MDSFNKLTDLFRQFPGIGPRQAKRFVYFLLSKDRRFLDELVKSIGALPTEISECLSCHRFFAKRASALCPLCADKTRSDAELMILAKDTDLDAIEKSGEFRGRYFVLGGTIPLLEKKGTDTVRLQELLAHVGKVQPSLREIILALSANPEGEYTADELRRMLSPVAGSSVKITTLGRGLSTGSELEYADQGTIKSALRNRSSGA